MRLTLRRKILLGYGAVLLLVLLVLVWAIVNLLRLGQASEAILSENYRSITAAENMIDALERQDSGVLLYILGFEDEGITQVREHQSTFARWLARAEDNITIPGEAEGLHRIDSTHMAYLFRFTELIQQQGDQPVDQSGDRPPSIRMQYHEVLLPAFMTVRDAATSLRDLNEATMVAASDRAGRVARTAVLSMGLVGLVTLTVGFLFSLVLSNRLVRPIWLVGEATTRIAEGDYDVHVPASPSDELGMLAVQFNEMVAQLRRYRDLNVERLMAEKRKSDAILQSIDDGLIVIDADLRIQAMNPVAGTVFGVDVEAVTGQHVLEAIGREPLARQVKETLTSGEAPAIEEADAFISMEHDGTQRHYQYVVTPVRAGAQRFGLVLLRDVTKLKELDRLKSEFVATASHELKTPLTSIGMSIGLLKERALDKLSEGERDLLAVAAEDVERLRRLVGDLLDLSKIEAGRIELAFEPVPVALVFEQATQTMRAQAEEKGIDLILDVPADLPPVEADANKVTWILTNLISNALRYTAAGGRIVLAAAVAGTKMHLSVRDNGEGIPYAYQAKIFDKFVQVDGQKATGGSGLGLAICKEIVRAHGGSIWVDSTPGVGSTFTFTLPLAEQALVGPGGSN